MVDDALYDELNEKAFDTIVLGVTATQLKHIEHIPNDGKAAWEIFARLYDASHAQRPTRLALRRQLYKASPMDAGESVSAFVARKHAISEKLLDLGTLVDESELADCILMDVADDFRSVAALLERRGAYSLADVRAALTKDELERKMRAMSTAETPLRPNVPAKLPLLGMGADHGAGALVRQNNTARAAKRRHQDECDDAPDSDEKRSVGENGDGGGAKDEFKKPRMGNGVRKQKVPIR